MATVLDDATAAWMAQHPFWMPGPIAQPQSQNVLEIPPAVPYGGLPEQAAGPPVSAAAPQPQVPGMTQEEMDVQPSVMEDPGAKYRRVFRRWVWPGGAGPELVSRAVNFPFEMAAQAISQAPPIKALGPYAPLATNILTSLMPWTVGALPEAAGRLFPETPAPPTRPTVPLGSQTLDDILPNMNPRFKRFAIAHRTVPLPEMEAAPQSFHGARRGPIRELLPPEMVSDPTSTAGPALYSTNSMAYAREAAMPSAEAEGGGPVYRVTEIPHYDPQGRPIALRFFDLDTYPLSRPQLERMVREIPERIRNPRNPAMPIKARQLFRLNIRGFEKENAIKMLNRYAGRIGAQEPTFEERVMQPEVVKAFRKVLGNDYDGVVYNERPIRGLPEQVTHKAYFNPTRDVHLSPMPESEWGMRYVRDVTIPEMPPGGPYGSRAAPVRVGPPTVK